ncbi:acetyl-CoA acetyltransferase [Variovorax sp. PBL-E5]|uniref:acetyl-CoA acetyltransferase n=1 Tax=Variovorax sp. PBL-E5 TaxID=434014 RepID=UPI0013195D0B|nr:acetyl-CoA acetyltransferase [Variovorax sp. PBL-E5]VTU30315.1 3-ketoacyl-CoA thiolase [Variovorax sp. PBL-E5]
MAVVNLKPCAIAGVAESDLGTVPDRTATDLAVQASLAALDDAGLKVSQVDAVFTCNLSRFSAIQLSEHLGIQPRYLDSTLVGGASFEMHLAHACAAIQAGLCEVALIAYGSVQRSKRARKLEGFVESGTSAAQYETVYAPLYPLSFYAMVAQRYMHDYGATPEQLANVAVSARQWAALNPKAFKREPLTVAEVLASPMVSSPLHALDCCLVTDGGGAVIVTSLERAKTLARRPVQVLGYAETTTHDAMSQVPDLLHHGSAVTGARALGMAGVTTKEIDVIQIYDAFTINVLVGLENLGFCQPGEAAALVADGCIGPGGSLPVNTQGGGLSYCHPGMFGIFLLIEAVRQLRGECGERQVPKAETALCHATGGIFSAHASVVLGVR